MSMCISPRCTNQTRGLRCSVCLALSAADAPRQQQPVKPKAPFPGRVVLVVPWTALASDNLRKAPLGKAAAEKQSRYKEALARFRAKIGEQYSGQPAAGPVRITATFWVPDNLVRDAIDFGKLIGDGLKELVIADDRWQVLKDARFVVEGIDRDRPRCELVVEAL